MLVVVLVCGSANTLLVWSSLKALFNRRRIWIEGLRILAEKLLLANSLVGVSHFVVDAAPPDLGSLSSIVWKWLLLLLAHLVVVSHSVHFTNYFTI